MPYPEQTALHKGWFPDTFAGCEGRSFAFVSIGAADLYAPTAAALPLFWDRLSPGGALLIHDVNGARSTAAWQGRLRVLRRAGHTPHARLRPPRQRHPQKAAVNVKPPVWAAFLYFQLFTYAQSSASMVAAQ